MSSDTSATGEIPALEPPAGPWPRRPRQASGLAALAPDPVHDPASPGPAAASPPAGAAA